ncbi:TNFAIP3-interacting protein 1-like [Parambassis ranga]|uniref:TNFAIP3-interacting protein 1-like n=1 Tax=Parambassis ranga TaxID=210632 RepID=A0A6P7KLY2_9TELE|nr:TNFAIP3-interacting protein 1-like [Parambassis ranga]
MSLHKNSADRPPVDTPRPSETVNTTYKRRLYPSLPITDRYEFCLPVGSAREKRPPAPEFHPKCLLEDTESEVPPPSSDAMMRAQIHILEEQKKELLIINEKWAKEYRTMEQYYKEKVQALRAAQLQEEETCEEGEKRLTLYKKVKFKTVNDKENAQTAEGGATSDLLRAEREATELRLQNGTLTRRGQHQHEEIKRLNKALEEALQPLSASGETLHDVWKHQAEVYKEDFVRERRDREKLKDKYLELEKKFRKAHNELSVLRSQVSWTRQQQPSPLHCACTHRAKSPNLEDGQITQKHMLLQRRYTLNSKH